MSLERKMGPAPSSMPSLEEIEQKVRKRLRRKKRIFAALQAIRRLPSDVQRSILRLAGKCRQEPVIQQQLSSWKNVRQKKMPTEDYLLYLKIFQL